MSTMPTTPRRHALGLPPGSIRATHLLLVVALVCVSILMPTRSAHPEPIPAYLVYLLLLTLGHYFAHRSHVKTVGEAHPLYLPKGVIRFLVMAALAGAIGWKLYSNPADLKAQFELTIDQLKGEPIMPLLVLGGFFLGVLVRAVVGRDSPPQSLQDLEAWLSLISTLGLALAAIIHIVINPSISSPLDLPHWEGFLAAIVAFYFGERS